MYFVCLGGEWIGEGNTLDEVVVTAEGNDDDDTWNPWNPNEDDWYYDENEEDEDNHNTGGGGEETINIVVEAPDNPIEDMEEYLECFDASQGAVVTIYADQPNPNNPNYDHWNGNAGHAFISIEQNGYVKSYGFYPESGWGLLGSTTGIMGNDENHTSDVSVTIPVSGATLQTLITHSLGFSETDYNLQDINCTHFAVSSANIVGFNIPISECIGVYGVGQSGASPAKLGQYMRGMDLPTGATRNLTGGNSPTNSECEN